MFWWERFSLHIFSPNYGVFLNWNKYLSKSIEVSGMLAPNNCLCLCVKLCLSTINPLKQASNQSFLTEDTSKLSKTTLKLSNRKPWKLTSPVCHGCVKWTLSIPFLMRLVLLFVASETGLNFMIHDKELFVVGQESVWEAIWYCIVLSCICFPFFLIVMNKQPSKHFYVR